MQSKAFHSLRMCPGHQQPSCAVGVPSDVHVHSNSVTISEPKHAHFPVPSEAQLNHTNYSRHTQAQAVICTQRYS